MKRFLLICIPFLLIVIGYILLSNNAFGPTVDIASDQQENNQSDEQTNNLPDETVVAEQLDTPWSIVLLPDGALLVTERQGTVRIIRDDELALSPVATLRSVREVGEGGLLGIAIHPDFQQNNFVYLYYTYHAQGSNTLNKVVRMTMTDGELVNEQVIVDKIPGASNHNGGRIAFGPDGHLYIGTGDAQEPSLAQDRNSLAGKILRVTDEGGVPRGNPFNTPVYSYGHRNVQGLAWDDNGVLYATEHGRSGIASGYDELNRIEAGKNYGWPDSEGDTVRANTVGPIRHSGANDTWAPSGMAFLDGSFYFTGLRGRALYHARVEGGRVTQFSEHLKGEYGRIRDIITTPDGALIIATSNRDGRGSPIDEDDRIVKLSVRRILQ